MWDGGSAERKMTVPPIVDRYIHRHIPDIVKTRMRYDPVMTHYTWLWYNIEESHPWGYLVGIYGHTHTDRQTYRQTHTHTHTHTHAQTHTLFIIIYRVIRGN